MLSIKKIYKDTLGLNKTKRGTKLNYITRFEAQVTTDPLLKSTLE